MRWGLLERTTKKRVVKAASTRLREEMKVLYGVVMACDGQLGHMGIGTHAYNLIVMTHN